VFDGERVANQKEWKELVTVIARKNLFVFWEKKKFSESIFSRVPTKPLQAVSISLEDFEKLAWKFTTELRAEAIFDSPADLDRLAQEWGYGSWNQFDECNDPN
jgi:hypothetical protein